MPINKIFNHVLSYYVQKFNRKYKRKGRLMEGPLQHIRIVKERHLFSLCQYIHLNPVKAGLVNTPSEWAYSNFREWVGHRSGVLYSNDILYHYCDNCRENYWEAIEQNMNLWENLQAVTFD